MISRLIGRNGAILTLILALLVVSPFILRSAFWLDNSILISAFALLAVSAGMSYGQAGIPSVVTAGFAAIGAYASANICMRLGLSPWLGLPTAMILPALLAYPMARVVTRLSPLPLSIATFALSGVLEVAIREGGSFTGGYIGLSGVPPIPGAGEPWQMHFLGWGSVILILWLYSNLMDSSFGRAVKTARHDALRATADGVDVGGSLALFFSLTAAVAGMAGWLYGHYISYLGPDSFTTHTSITVLLMAVVGGAQSFLGPVLGAAILMLVTNYLPAAETQGMVFGATLVLVMLLAPRGVAGLALDAARAIKRRWTGRRQTPPIAEPVVTGASR